MALREGFKRLAIVLAVIVAFAMMLWRQTGPIEPLEQRSLATLCRVDYAKARSATDTAFVDGHKSAVNKLTAVTSASCGQLRRAGALKL